MLMGFDHAKTNPSAKLATAADVSVIAKRAAGRFCRQWHSMQSLASCFRPLKSRDEGYAEWWPRLHERLRAWTRLVGCRA